MDLTHATATPTIDRPVGGTPDPSVPVAPVPLPVIRRLNDPVPVETAAIDPELQAATLAGANSPATYAAALLASADPVYTYGREPRTDEQLEVTASAKYLHVRKVEWEDELAARDDATQNMTGRADVRPAWETFQRGVTARTDPTEPNAVSPPWFLNPAFGYQVNDPGRQQALQNAGARADAPDVDDPQQLLGSTYNRDTQFPATSRDAQGRLAQFDSAHPLAGGVNPVGHVLRLFDAATQHGAANEIRLQITARAPLGGGTWTGTVLATPHFANFNRNVGDVVVVESPGDGSLTVRGNGQDDPLAVNAWTAELNTVAHLNAVVLPLDAIGLRFGGGRNRGAPAPLDDAMAQRVIDRQGAIPGSNLNHANSLGPTRNPLDLGELGWGISVDSYRRFGGDTIFTEAPHPGRNPALYGANHQIAPNNAVDVRNPNWYDQSQEHVPDRFVGGRSNSTMNYMQTASLLFHAGTLTVDEAKDVMAFVIADMVVSGEHSMPECMTTVIRVAGLSPPWNTIAALNITNPIAALRAWFGLVDAATLQRMRVEVRQALEGLMPNDQQMDDGNGPRWDTEDRTLLKVLVALGKIL